MTHRDDSPNDRSLARLFAPKRVALVGASERLPWSHWVDAAIRQWNYGGDVVAINLRGNDVHGRKGFISLGEAGGVDAAFVMVPPAAIPDVVRDAGAAGVRGLVVLTSGFAELGAEGQAAERALVALAQDHGVALMGPNSMGFVDLSGGYALTTLPPLDAQISGGVAVVSQSGLTAGEIQRAVQRYNGGLSFLLSTGNEALTGLPDMIDYLVDHAATRVIAVYAESVRDPARFVAAARRARLAGKPIVMLKVGRSELTAAVAAAHTGALAGDDRVFEAICAELRIIRVTNIDDLAITAILFDQTGRIDRPGVAFVSTSGGSCTMAADAAADAGVHLPAFSPDTVAALRTILPSYGGSLNPLDLTGGFAQDKDLISKAIEVVGRDPAIGRVFAGFEVPDDERRAQSYGSALASLGRGLSSCDPPGLLMSQGLTPANDATRNVFAASAIPGYVPGIENGFRAIGRIIAWSSPLPHVAAPAPLAAIAHDHPTQERAVLDLLARNGVAVVPSTVTRSPEEAARAAGQDSVALKILSPDIAHKTEAGGVRLALRGPEMVGSAWREIDAAVRRNRPDARIDGIAVSPMRHGGIELIVGVARDPQWGLMLTVGLGGVLVEVLKDSVLAPLPVDAARIEAMLRALRGRAIFDGYRGAPPVDLPALARTIARIGAVAAALGPRLQVLEINPLHVDGARSEALDALAIWNDPQDDTERTGA